MIDFNELLNLMDRYTAQRGPYGRQPSDVMIVTAVASGYVNCRHAYDSASNGYNYPFLTTYAPAVGDRVLVENYPGGPVVTGKMSS